MSKIRYCRIACGRASAWFLCRCAPRSDRDTSPNQTTQLGADIACLDSLCAKLRRDADDIRFPRGKPEHLLSPTSQKDGWVGALERLQLVLQTGDSIEGAGERDGFRRQALLDEAHRFLQAPDPRPRRVHGQAELAILVQRMSRAKPELEASPGKLIQGSDFLRKQDRVTPVITEDKAARKSFPNRQIVPFLFVKECCLVLSSLNTVIKEVAVVSVILGRASPDPGFGSPVELSRRRAPRSRGRCRLTRCIRHAVVPQRAGGAGPARADASAPGTR